MPSNLNKHCKCECDSAHLQQRKVLHGMGLPTLHGGWGGAWEAPPLPERTSAMTWGRRIIFHGSTATRQLSRIQEITATQPWVTKGILTPKTLYLKFRCNSVSRRVLSEAKTDNLLTLHWYTVQNQFWLDTHITLTLKKLWLAPENNIANQMILPVSTVLFCY